MFDSIFDEMAGGGWFGGDESAAGITDYMGMDGGTWGDYSGGTVFDQQFPSSMDIYNPSFGAMLGGGAYDTPDSSWASGGGGGLGGLFSNMNLGSIARGLGSALSIGSGVNALSQARRLQEQAQQADPMAPYRAGWAARLNALLDNPGSITSEPGYEAGLEAVKRGGAAAGFFGSGNMVGNLAQFGTDFYDRAVARFAGLVGGTPGGGLRGTESAINLGNAGINRISSGIASMANGLFDD